MGAQYNTPNPDCDEELFGKLYVDTDPSQFDPLNATDAQWAEIQQWAKDHHAASGKR